MNKEFVDFTCNKTCTHSRVCPRVKAEIVKHNNDRIDIMFCGIGLGKTDLQMNMNFVGPAGKYLRQSIAYLWKSKLFNVAFTNNVKFRPSEIINGKIKDREPTYQEQLNCREFLLNDIEIINPRVIIPVGKCATLSFLPDLKDLRMSDIRNIKNKTFNNISVIPTWHPSFLTRQYGKFKEDNKEIFHNQFLNDIIYSLRLK